jgi:hypothetical protein
MGARSSGEEDGRRELDELRAVVDGNDGRLAEVRAAVGRLPRGAVDAVCVELLLLDTMRRAADQLAQEPVEPWDAEQFADALDQAKTLNDAIEGIDDPEAVLLAAFEGVSSGEAHLMAYERGLRALFERRRGCR